MKKLLFVMLITIPFNVIGQVSNFAEKSYLASIGDEFKLLWLTDTPLTLKDDKKIKAIELIYPEVEGFKIVHNFSESDGGSESYNAIKKLTKGDYRIIVEKNKGKNNEEGVLILTSIYSEGGIPNGINFILNYKFISETEVIISIDNKRALYYLVEYSKEN
jgi:hypothetical protein